MHGAGCTSGERRNAENGELNRSGCSWADCLLMHAIGARTAADGNLSFDLARCGASGSRRLSAEGCTHSARTESVDEGAVVAAGGREGALLEQRIRQRCPRPDPCAADLFKCEHQTSVHVFYTYMCTSWFAHCDK